MVKKKLVIALIYDFDGTLSPQNMQEYDFLKAIGIKDKNLFWEENSRLVHRHEASNILCYMKLMIDKAHNADVSIKRQQFVEFGKNIELYKGVEGWFKLMEEVAKENDVKIEHYINSSGLKEMIEGTSIAKEFKEIYACSFMYVDDVAIWPAVAVDFTAKTQFLFMINKGISKVSDNAKINEYVPEDQRPIPFKHMVYFGDGETDIPCMKLVKQQGGYSIAVYKPRNPKKKACAEKLVRDERVNFACSADYSKNSEIYSTVVAVIKKMKSEYDLTAMEKANRNKFEEKK